MRILVVGGTGDIGSHMVKSLGRAGAHITSLADSQQSLLASGGMLSWHKPNPGSQLTTTLKIGRITNHGNECRSRDHPVSLNEIMLPPMIEIITPRFERFLPSPGLQ